MKKITIFGAALFLLGVLLVSFQVNITGNVVSEKFGNINSILNIAFIILGLLLMVGGNLETRAETIKYDAVIILCRNWRGYPLRHKVSSDGKLRLHGASKMNCAVAADMYKRGNVKKIIFGTGKSAGERFPSEAQAMKEHLTEKLKIPEKDILTQEKNLDTYEELDEDFKLAKKNNLNRLVLATVGTQLSRCRKYLGNKVDEYIVSEDYAESMPNWRRYADKYKESFVARYESVKEFILRRFQDVGITKRFTKPLAKLVRR